MPSQAPQAPTKRGDPTRVAEVQRQARHSLLVAAAFSACAPLAAVIPHSTGSWLPLHLFLVGGLLNAISGATQFLAVTWSASPAPARLAALVQLVVLSTGAAAVAMGRELGHASLSSAGGVGVAAALILLANNLLRVRRTAVTDRFVPAIDGYLLAIANGVVGTALAVWLVAAHPGTRWDDIRAAHLTVNLFGLVGVVIASTLPYFVATQARTKMSRRFTSGRLRATTIGLTVATAAATIGHLEGNPKLAAAGYSLYVVALLATLLLLPDLQRRQLSWAGPRLVQLAAGIAWWVAAAGILAADALAQRADTTPVLRALVLGGFAQILVASLAYFGPVLRGGGHERLSAGFASTRSWPGLVVANVAAAAALAGWSSVLAIALAIWVLDTGFRGARFAGLDRGPMAGRFGTKGPSLDSGHQTR